MARFRLSSCNVEGTRNVCAPREKKQGSPAKAPGVDGVNGGVLQSSDAMTEAMSSIGWWRGGGVGGRKRINCGSALFWLQGLESAGKRSFPPGFASRATSRDSAVARRLPKQVTLSLRLKAGVQLASVRH